MTDAGSARISMNMDGAMAGDGEGIMHFGDDGVAMELSMPLSGLQEMTMRLVDGAMYAAMPPYTPKGKWFKIDADQAGMAEALKQYESFDPRAMTEQLRDSDTTVKKVGSTRIDGTEVTHYKVSSKTEAGRQTYDMFLDADSLVRRMKFDSAGQQMVMDFSDWGNAPEVKAPPKSDLVEAPPMPS
ncbi:MAG: hypothetical protein HZY75_11490 [Nocardioidaceae bacterium]|nr:MAG: hypothetical protein HZY75_11490 [Nocardioidaceae bacterium]